MSRLKDPAAVRGLAKKSAFEAFGQMCDTGGPILLDIMQFRRPPI